MPGRRRQSADAFCTWDRDALCYPLHVYEPVGNLRLRHSDEDRFALLEEFFYKRGYDERATTAISVDEVFDAVMTQLEAAASVASDYYR